MQSIGTSFLNTPVPGVPESSEPGYFVKRSSDNDHIRVPTKLDELAVRGLHPQGVSRLPSSRSSDDPSSYANGQKDRAGGYDWLVVYNPKVPRALTVNLNHTLTHESVVCAVRFDPTGQALATGSNKAVRIFDVKTGNLLITLTDPEMDSGNEDQFFRTVAFSPNGKLLACGSEDSLIRVWDLQSQKLLFRLAGHDQDIYSVEFFDNGRKIASGSGDKTVKLWDLTTQKCLNTLHAGTPDSTKDSGITSLSVSPNGKFLAAGSLDRLIRIWSLPSGAPVDVIEGHGDSIYSTSFTADGRHLLSGSLDKTVRLWQFESDEYLKGATCVYDLVGHKDFVLSVAGSPDARWFLTGSKDRSVQCWDRATGSVQFMLQGHKNSVIGITYSPTGNIFATASGDFRARIWSFEPFESAPTEQHEPKQRRLDDVDEEQEEEGSGEDLEMEESDHEEDQEDEEVEASE